MRENKSLLELAVMKTDVSSATAVGQEAGSLDLQNMQHGRWHDPIRDPIRGRDRIWHDVPDSCMYGSVPLSWRETSPWINWCDHCTCSCPSWNPRGHLLVPFAGFPVLVAPSQILMCRHDLAPMSYQIREGRWGSIVSPATYLRVLMQQRWKSEAARLTARRGFCFWNNYATQLWDSTTVSNWSYACLKFQPCVLPWYITALEDTTGVFGTLSLSRSMNWVFPSFPRVTKPPWCFPMTRGG